jgi:ABC-type sugar transport system permease subunit
MKIDKPNTGFWAVLTAVNALAMGYPIHLLLRAKSVDENLFATFVFVGSLLLVVVVDAVGIVAADAVGTGKRREH